MKFCNLFHTRDLINVFGFILKLIPIPFQTTFGFARVSRNISRISFSFSKNTALDNCSMISKITECFCYYQQLDRIANTFHWVCMRWRDSRAEFSPTNYFTRLPAMLPWITIWSPLAIYTCITRPFPARLCNLARIVPMESRMLEHALGFPILPELCEIDRQSCSETTHTRETTCSQNFQLNRRNTFDLFFNVNYRIKG